MCSSDLSYADLGGNRVRVTCACGKFTAIGRRSTSAFGRVDEVGLLHDRHFFEVVGMAIQGRQCIEKGCERDAVTGLRCVAHHQIMQKHGW